MSEYNDNYMLNDIKHLQNQNSYDFQEIKRIGELIESLQNSIRSNELFNKNRIKKLESQFKELVRELESDNAIVDILIRIENLKTTINNISNSINQINGESVIINEKITNIENISSDNSTSLIDLQTLANSNKENINHILDDLITTLDKQLQDLANEIDEINGADLEAINDRINLVERDIITLSNLINVDLTDIYTRLAQLEAKVGGN